MPSADWCKGCVVAVRPGSVQSAWPVASEPFGLGVAHELVFLLWN